MQKRRREGLEVQGCFRPYIVTRAWLFLMRAAACLRGICALQSGQCLTPFAVDTKAAAVGIPIFVHGAVQLGMKQGIGGQHGNAKPLARQRIGNALRAIATCTRRRIGTVESALEVLIVPALAEVLNDGAYCMSDIQRLIGQSSTGGRRKSVSVCVCRSEFLPTATDRSRKWPLPGC